MSAAPLLHRVTVEFVTSAPRIADFTNADDALAFIESAKQVADAWHIFVAVPQSPGGELVVVLSLYRSHDTGEWSVAVGGGPP